MRIAQALGAILFLLASASILEAQRAFEQRGEVIFESSEKRQTNLGVGFNPILTAEGKVVFMRGRHPGYGDDFDCTKDAAKNWVARYDPITGQESRLFDRPIKYDGPNSLGFCLFEQMQLSHDGTTLYLLAATYATSGNLAIINLASELISFVPGVIAVFLIETGPHRDELIYQRRVWHKSPADGLEYPAYPLIHALADGRQIREISDENFTVAGNDKMPILRKYLREINGTIHANGQKMP